MKKRFSILTVIIVGFFMMATGVYANDLYREWVGSDDFRQTEENLENIQVGITTLQGNLEATESELATTKSELETAKSDSSTKQKTIDKLNDEVDALEKERADTITSIKNELQDGIREVNGKKGPRKKYDVVKEVVNKWADKLSLAKEDRLVDHSTSTEYDEKVKKLEDKEQELKDKQEELNTKESELSKSNSDLKQAEEDMKSLKNQSGEVLKSLNLPDEPTEDD